MLRRGWDSGASVPYPVEQTELGLMMEFIGDETQAAPKLAQARLSTEELTSAWQQLIGSLVALTMAGLVHADLSAYNLLWWEGRLVVIDLPQAVEFTTNPDAFDLLHRDVANVGEWFTRRGVELDVEAVYAELVVDRLAGLTRLCPLPRGHAPRRSSDWRGPGGCDACRHVRGVASGLLSIGARRSTSIGVRSMPSYLQDRFQPAPSRSDRCIGQECTRDGLGVRFRPICRSELHQRRS